MRFVMRMGPGRGRGPYERQPFHAEDGSFVLEDVPAGRWTVEAFAQGYQSGSASAVSVGEGEATEGVEVRLSQGRRALGPGAGVAHRAADPGRHACAPSSRAADARMGMIRIGGEGDDNETSTDAEGRYEIAGLAPGTLGRDGVAPRLERGDGERRAQGRARHAGHPARPGRLGRRHGPRRRPSGGRRARWRCRRRATPACGRARA